MSNHHRIHSYGDVPFSWETSPGVSKLGVAPNGEEMKKVVIVKGKMKDILKIPLPPPPCPTGSPKLMCHGIHVPLPPCPFQPPKESSYSKMRRRRKEDDPFLAAYMECTGTKKGLGSKEKSRAVQGRSGTGFGFSCKSSIGVREDAMVVRGRGITRSMDRQ